MKDTDIVTYNYSSLIGAWLYIQNIVHPQERTCNSYWEIQENLGWLPGTGD